LTVVVGTAGHIDHGKTALLRALTGIDADRLPEERRRGLSIDIGYAHGSPDGGAEIDFVDVPGHDRLVGNMLVGVGEIDAALLVVAADDGPRAQTWEHLGLLDAMHIDRGIVVITKADLVDAARAGEVAAVALRAIAPTSLAGAPVVVVSATTGFGLDRLRGELGALRDRVESGSRPGHRGAWLAVDRAFSVRGRGVVATGSSRGLPIATGDALLLRPGSIRVRVRGVHVHDLPAESPSGGGRVALNLGGIGLDTVRRGQLLTSASPVGGPATPVEVDRLLVELWRPASLPTRLPDDPWPPRDGTEGRLHIGTDQVAARLGRSGRVAAVSDVDRVFAVLRLERAVATAMGEVFVLRRPAPAGLLAGGRILDVVVARGRARARVTPERLARLAEAVSGRQEGDIVPALADLRGAWGRTLAPDIDSLARSRLVDTVAGHHAEHPDRTGLPISAARSVVADSLGPWVGPPPGDLDMLVEDVIDTTVSSERLVRDVGALRLPSYEPATIAPARSVAMDRLVELLDTTSPPPLSQAARDASCPPEAVSWLEKLGRIVVVADDLAWSSAAFVRLRDLALTLVATQPLTPARLRDETGSSRKYVMALLEDLDRRGILKRTPAGHVRGPRA
jgi:selenocysteine-specific elongation factor